MLGSAVELSRIRGLPVLFRPVPFGCSTVFLFTVLGASLGPLLFSPTPSPDGLGEECGNWVIGAVFAGGVLGFVVGGIASPFVGALLQRRSRLTPRDAKRLPKTAPPDTL
jgi:hypothetical protein